MKIARVIKRLSILLIIGALLFINVIPSFAEIGNLTYTYDDLNRLTAIEDATGNKVEYQYDEVGNRTQKIVNFSYTVTFDSQGADVTANPTSKTVVPPATTIDALPTPPTKAGYTFAGWFTAVNGGGTQFTAATAVTGNIKVYAKWDSSYYTVTFDSQGADVAAIPTSKTVGPPATTIDALPTPPTKAGSTFAGWFTAVNGGGTQFTASTAVMGNITVYAKWGSDYAITASAGENGSISPPGTTTVPYNGSQTFTITPAAGYEILNITVDNVLVGCLNAIYTFININANHIINVSFVTYTEPVSISGTYYATLQAAYDAAGDGATIKVKAKTLTENLNVNRNISVNIEGGYDALHSGIIGNTTLKGKIQTLANGGTITIKNFILQN